MSVTGSIKNPNHEAETPAPVANDAQKEKSLPGRNRHGNDRGDAEPDPEGQQGSTTRRSGTARQGKSNA